MDRYKVLLRGISWAIAWTLASSAGSVAAQEGLDLEIPTHAIEPGPGDQAEQRVIITGNRIPGGPPAAPPPTPFAAIADVHAGTSGTPAAGSGGGSVKPTEAKETPSSDNNSQAKGCTKQPVVLTTGAKYKNEQDFSAEGFNDLGLTRIYRSATAGGQIFGAYWHSTLDAPTLKPIEPCRINPDDAPKVVDRTSATQV